MHTAGTLVESVYIGGGTPSLADPERIAGLVETTGKHFRLKGGAEVTIEANPSDISGREILLAYKSAGINRLSLGIQSLNDRLLKVLGRRGGRKDALRSLAAASSVKGLRLSADLICGIPGQRVSDLLSDIKELLSRGVTHVSVYALSVPAGTPLFREIKDKILEPPDEELEVKLYLAAKKLLENNGFRHYEISNFAKKGRECYHNIGYWMQRPYIGLGAAAVSFDGKSRYYNEQNLGKYMRKINKGLLPVRKAEIIGPEKQLAEYIFLRLRLLEGIDLLDMAGRFPGKVSEFSALSGDLKKRGLLSIAGGKIKLTVKGILYSNDVFAELI